MDLVQFLAGLKRNADAVLMRASIDLAAGNADAAAGILANKFVTPSALAYVLGNVSIGDAATLNGASLQDIVDSYTAHVQAQITQLTSDMQIYVDTADATIVGSAPTALNSLEKLAAAINNDANFAATVTAAFNSHSTDTANPHGVTKEQVGLGQVSNYAVATQATAEAGTANNVYVTPLRVAQAITAQGATQFLGITAQAADSAKLGGSTLAQVIASAQAGNAATATKLQTARTIAISGAGTASGSFDGSGNLTLALVLAVSGVAAGTYTKLTVNDKGLVTGGAALAASDIPNLDMSKISTGTLGVGQGGTGGTTQASARSGLGIGSMATRNVTISTAAPSGGSDGDVWLQYS